MDQVANFASLGVRRPPQILPLRQQSALILEMVRGRLDTILPAAMHDAGIDMWIVLCQEDDLDPLFRTMISFDNWCPQVLCLVFARDGDGIRRYNLSRCDTADLYERPERENIEDRQFEVLAKLVQQHDPERIGLNTGSVAWCAGGLTHNMYLQLCQALPRKYTDRFCSAEKAGVRWASTMTDTEVVLFKRVTELGRYMIGECFNARAITPGVTTIDDLTWHYWQHSRDLGLDVAFRPYFRVHRDLRDTSYPPDVVAPGDVIHCDTGIRYLRFNSDHQHVAYVPRLGETDAPEGLKRRMRETNHLQDIFMDEFRHGISGNALQQNILKRARAEGVPTPRVYSHNLGLFLHQPGPLIGLPWEQENPLARGEVTLEYNSAFVMELSTEAPVPEWHGQPLRMAMEEPVVFTTEGCRTLCGRQTEYHVI